MGEYPLRSAFQMSAFMRLLFAVCGVIASCQLTPRVNSVQNGSTKPVYADCRPFDVRREVLGTPPTHGLIVSNHLSYLDIPATAPRCRAFSSLRPKWRSGPSSAGTRAGRAASSSAVMTAAMPRAPMPT